MAERMGRLYRLRKIASALLGQRPVSKLHEQLRTTAPSISAVILNWNRDLLLRSTVYSILARTRVPFDLTIIDNGSTDTSPLWLAQFARQMPSSRVLCLTRNRGGEAFNEVIDKLKGDYVLFCENDLEFLPGWDESMLLPFLLFPELGAISPFAPQPNSAIGESWSPKPYKLVNKQGQSLYRAAGTLGTTVLVRRELLRKGLRWRNITGAANDVVFPDDAGFSQQISNLGYWLAWSASHQALNWGHVAAITTQYQDYFKANYLAKADLKIDGLGELRSELDASEGQPLLKMSQLQQEVTFLREELRLLRSTHRITAPLALKDRTMLYYDAGSGFEPSCTVITECSLGAPDFSIRFDLRDTGPVKALRWDPLEGLFCKVRLDHVRIGSKGGTTEIAPERLSHNGTRLKDGSIRFLTNDPMFFIPASGEADWIELSGHWELI